MTKKMWHAIYTNNTYGSSFFDLCSMLGYVLVLSTDLTNEMHLDIINSYMSVVCIL